MASQKMQDIGRKLSDVNEEARIIIADAEAQGRDLTDSEQLDLRKLHAQFESLTAQFQAAEMDDKLSAPKGSAPHLPFARSNNTGGFRSIGQYLLAVKNAAGGNYDQRLISLSNAVSTYGNEQLGPDGGFAVPSDWRNTIMELVTGEGTLVNAFNPLVTPSNMITLPVSETTAHGSTGITAAWTGEGGTITASKPLLKQVNISLYKVAALVHASDEILEDNPAMNGYIAREMARKIRGVVEDALVAGDGVGKPTGLLNGPGLVTVDNATTVLSTTDLGNMVARLTPGSFDRAFWLCHTSALPHLWSLQVGTSTPVLVPDYTKSPYGTILGRPVLTSEGCSDYNTKGDLFLVDPVGYALAVKSSGLRTDATIGFAFDQGLQSFRAQFRIGGQPLLSAPVARKNGSATLSSVVCLDVRS